MLAESIAYDFDTDGDHLGNTAEVEPRTSPTNPDTDGDGLVDGGEIAAGTNPLNPDTDGDGRPDGVSDADADGLGNAAELSHGTDPLNPDTDNDGVLDGAEVKAGTNPTARALGTFTASGADTGPCPTDSTCVDYTVSCPDVPEVLGGVLATAVPAGTPTGS